ncbi:site-specific recombinase XerD [Mycolicibacterium rhodesiae NBB3]|uniref:Site-specific recombinase XerD n=1 Tax=Mycolicibacterium rhodesiae (strain NBB3) TaxID=710685 RepID=G8RX79_MYCRN|nr:site-specific integrase [Mycolicibacterium rhodesiae]AEV73127.1 site-specific recombinase XerD [Mycolicibacterium rhodesiae NBB3]
MAYIRTHETTARRNGKPVKRHEVVWTEAATDANGLPIPGKKRSRQESYTVYADAQARQDALNAAKRTPGGTTALAEQKKAAMRTVRDYAAEWLTVQELKVTSGAMMPRTVVVYRDYVKNHVLKALGDRAIGTITRKDCQRYLADLHASGAARSTIRLAWQMLSRLLDYATHDGALAANPANAVDKRAQPKAPARRPHPMTAAQVAELAQAVGERDPLYELLVLFMCYTGLRKTEAQGLEVRDVTLTVGPKGVDGGTLHVERTKDRRKAPGADEPQWHTGPLKGRPEISDENSRRVDLPAWLARRLHDYLTDTHGDSGNPDAPLWPRRLRGGHHPKGSTPAARFDWSEPMDLDGLHKRVLSPALAAMDLDDVRTHDLRHTFAALQLGSGKHFMQVSEWLGHKHYTLTLNVYGKWMPADDEAGRNVLPDPTAQPAKSTKAQTVTPLRRMG